MEPRIQYAPTADGSSIAFWTLGQGEPLLVMPSGPWATSQIEWQIPAWLDWYEQIAQSRMVVRYDNRCTGLSHSSVSDFSLESNLSDLEAVTERLSLERFGLLGPQTSGPAAIAFSARTLKE